jgi:hypothetical protein
MPVASLDYLIRPLKHADWNCQTDLFCRLEVHDELKLRGLLDGQVSGAWLPSGFFAPFEITRASREFTKATDQLRQVCQKNN